MGCQLSSGVHADNHKYRDSAEVEGDTISFLGASSSSSKSTVARKANYEEAPQVCSGLDACASAQDELAEHAAHTIAMLMPGDNADDVSLAGSSDGSTRIDDVCGSSFGSAPMPGCLFLYDWDDTIFPTSWVQKNDLSTSDASVSMDQFVCLGQLAQCVMQNLKLSRQLGRVVIVTNADAGWVEQSCARFMPSLRLMLEDVTVVSARGTYETAEVTCPYEWKRQAFAHEIDSAYEGAASELRRNIVCLGDSMHEHVAMSDVQKGMQNCRTKSVKFITYPTIHQLIAQHQRLNGQLERLVTFDGDCSLEL